MSLAPTLLGNSLAALEDLSADLVRFGALWLHRRGPFPISRTKRQSGADCPPCNLAMENHGGYGAVLEAAQTARLEMEADPTTFFRCKVRARLRKAADRVAHLLGGRGEHWVFVENATADLHAIIASLDFSPRMSFSASLRSTASLALRYHAQRRGARVVMLPISVPRRNDNPNCICWRSRMHLIVDTLPNSTTRAPGTIRTGSLF